MNVIRIPTAPSEAPETSPCGSADHRMGGVARVSIGGPDGQQQPTQWQPAPAQRVVSSRQSYVIGEDFDHKGSVIATRKQINGHDTVEMAPGVSGSRTLIATAVKHGLLIQTGPGTYADAMQGGQR